MPEFLLFHDAGHGYALPVSAVLGIGRATKTSPLPFSAHFVDGVTAAFDRVVPQQSLARRIDPQNDASDADRLILVDDGAGATAIRVAAVEQIAFGRPTADESIPLGSESELFDGEILITGRFYRLIVPEALKVASQIVPGLEIDEPIWSAAAVSDLVADAVSENLLLFVCGGRQFAVAPQQVERLAPMPGVVHRVEGTAALMGRSRDDGSLVVSLAKQLDLQVSASPTALAVVSGESGEIAFAVDSIEGIHPCYQSSEAVDDRLVLADGTPVTYLDLMDLAQVFKRPVEAGRPPSLPLAKRRDAPASGARLRFQTLRVNESWYGLSADLMRQVGKPTGYAPLYGDACKYDGFIMLGGDALAAIDLHRVFQAPRHQAGVAAVMATPEGDIAFMCDALGQIDEIPADRVEEASQPFIAGHISRSGQTIQLIDTRSILQHGRES